MKGSVGEEPKEGVAQRGKVRQGVVVADVGACQRPDVFLRIEVGAGRQEKDRLNPLMRRQYVGHGLTFVPVGAVPQQQDGLVRIAGKQVFEESSGLDAVHL